MEETIRIEIEFMHKLGVYEEVSEEWVKERGLPIVGTRLLYTDKGDTRNTKIRARLVAQETKRVSQLGSENPAATFAATPPLESLRFLIIVDDWSTEEVRERNRPGTF